MKNREQTRRARHDQPQYYYQVYYYPYYPPAYAPSSHYAYQEDPYYAHEPTSNYQGYGDDYYEEEAYFHHSEYGLSPSEPIHFDALQEPRVRARDPKAKAPAPLGQKNSGTKKKSDKSTKKPRANAKAALGAEQQRRVPEPAQTRNRFFSADEAEVDLGNDCFVDSQLREPHFANNDLPEQRRSNALSHAEQKSLSQAAKISGIGTAETEGNGEVALGGKFASEGGASSFCGFESKEDATLSESRLSDDLVESVLAEALDEIQVELRPRITQNPKSVGSSAAESQSGFSNLGTLRDQLQFEKEMVKNSYKTRQFVWTIQQKGEEAENPFAFRGNGRIISKDYRLKLKTELCKSWMESGDCKYGDKCAFAHGEAELQKKKHVASRYKTKPCQSFHEKLFCPYGHRCQFIHSHAVGPQLSFCRSLQENTQCLRQRLQESANPFLNEFNLVYQGQVSRLAVFEAIASSDSQGSSEICPLNRRGRQTRGLIQSSNGATKRRRAPKQGQQS